MNNYIQKTILAIKNGNEYKKNKYLNKIIQNGGTVYTGEWKDGVFKGTVDGIPINVKNFWKNTNNKNITYLNKDSYYGEWDDNSNNPYKGTWVLTNKDNRNIGEWINSSFNYNKLDNNFTIYMDNQLNKSILYDKKKLIYNQFYQHLLFDEYIKKGMGNESEKVFDTFVEYLRSFNKNDKADILQSYYDKGKIELNEILEVNVIQDPNYSTIKYNEYSFNKKYTINKSKILILSGYSTGDGGHAINIFIDDNNDIYIINSGEGLNHVKEILNYKNTNINIGPVIIKYSNISNDDRKNIIGLCSFFKNIENCKDIKTSLKEYLKIFKFVEQCYVSSNNKICSKFIYLCISEILNSTGVSSKQKPILTCFKEEKEQLSGSCTFYSSFYFIKNFLGFDISGFQDFHDYLIKESIILYCDILYSDYKKIISDNNNILVKDNSEIKYYNDFLVLIKNYNFDNKINFLKIYEDIVKIKNNSYIKKKIVPLNSDIINFENFSELLKK